MKRQLIYVSALAASTLLPGSAQAWGPTCIPTLYNCMCTYLVPCPVTDPATVAQKHLQNLNLKEAMNVMQAIRDPQAAMLQAMRGQGPITIPGYDSIGIDVAGLVSGDLTSLGLSGEAGTLVQQLADVGIDGNTLVSIAKGELDPTDVVTGAVLAGLDASVLETTGLSELQLRLLYEGKLDTATIFDMATRVGAQAGILTDVGIDPALIYSVANGEVDASRVLEIAQKAGIGSEQLASIGLDWNTLQGLNGSSPAAVASLLQSTGFGSSLVTDLGLDAGLIAQISTGALPADAIHELVAGTGIDPNAIVLPGVNGPISLGNLPGSSNSDGRPSGVNDVITIPASTVPGLEGALQAATGTTQPSGLLSGPDNPSLAMCAGDLSLISVGDEPNGYGTDVVNINMALSGTTLETYAETKEEVAGVGAMTMGWGVARAMQVRPLLVKAIEAVDTFDAMIEESQTLQDDFIINDTIRAQLMTIKAEKTSLMASVLSTKSADVLRGDLVMSPLPLYTSEGRFRDMFKAQDRQAAKEPKRQAAIEADTYAKATQEYADLQTAARKAMHDYNMIRDARGISAGMSAIEDTIDHHEAYKSLVYYLEGRIQSNLGVLYGSSAANAWSVLRPQLVAAAGEFTSTSRYAASHDTANHLSQALTAQTEFTPYGARVMIYAGTEENPPRYSEVTFSSSSYPAIDDYAEAHEGEYKIEVENAMIGHGDDVTPNGGNELSNLIQYYFETLRREKFTGELRRGDAERSMTSAFWYEMIYHAPECLSGPIEYSDEAIAARPDMFDLSKDCEHLEWSYGDPGDYIDASELGGADAILWLSKINIERTLRRTGGASQVMENLQTALDALENSSAAALLQMQGYDMPTEHLGNIAQSLSSALSDAEFTESAVFPKP